MGGIGGSAVHSNPWEKTQFINWWVLDLYENLSDGNARDVEARANGVHTLGEKIQDGALADDEDYSYGGPQIAYTNGPLFAAAEYYYVRASELQTILIWAKSNLTTLQLTDTLHLFVILFKVVLM